MAQYTWEKFRALVLRTGLTQTRLAELTKTSPANINGKMTRSWMKGRTKDRPLAADFVEVVGQHLLGKGTPPITESELAELVHVPRLAATKEAGTGVAERTADVRVAVAGQPLPVWYEVSDAHWPLDAMFGRVSRPTGKIVAEEIMGVDAGKQFEVRVATEVYARDPDTPYTLRAHLRCIQVSDDDSFLNAPMFGLKSLVCVTRAEGGSELGQITIRKRQELTDRDRPVGIIVGVYRDL